jgi:hypothetical protein
MYGPISQWIVFRKYNNELPDSTPEQCISELVYHDNNHCIINNKINNENIDLYITFTKETQKNDWNFVRGFLYKNNVEILILSVVIFDSLQIGLFCYDKIAICYYL